MCGILREGQTFPSTHLFCGRVPEVGQVQQVRCQKVYPVKDYSENCTGTMSGTDLAFGKGFTVGRSHMSFYLRTGWGGWRGGAEG